ncbi:BMC domain-containing protein [Clostridium sp. SHJSY1]|uniref:BMC domain-containing protein n=1 Tax=Clostridium sp. SHJSY1 TaxID=2942483 RepID=UPI002875CE73|nr:BMC domain-containing protein [Clostridium sp. SHJSY1]MDS0528243.1 BMC domain-containing protein [Clostridium sp. SHJSY1]
MKEALGLVETRGLSNAILVADYMSKTANVKIIDVENTRGSGYITIKISGDVGAVNAAVSCGKQIAIENNSFISAKVIPRPSNNVGVTFCKVNKEKENISKENTSKEKSNNEVKSVEISDNTDKLKESVSSPEKSKPKKSTRKKVEPKKDE